MGEGICSRRFVNKKMQKSRNVITQALHHKFNLKHINTVLNYCHYTLSCYDTVQKLSSSHSTKASLSDIVRHTSQTCLPSGEVLVRYEPSAIRSKKRAVFFALSSTHAGGIPSTSTNLITWSNCPITKQQLHHLIKLSNHNARTSSPDQTVQSQCKNFITWSNCHCPITMQRLHHLIKLSNHNARTSSPDQTVQSQCRLHHMIKLFNHNARTSSPDQTVQSQCKNFITWSNCPITMQELLITLNINTKIWSKPINPIIYVSTHFWMGWRHWFRKIESVFSLNIFYF